jgi:hypothetical protein
MLSGAEGQRLHEVTSIQRYFHRNHQAALSQTDVFGWLRREFRRLLSGGQRPMWAEQETWGGFMEESGAGQGGQLLLTDCC